MRGAMIKVWRASLGSCYLEPISGRQRSVARAERDHRPIHLSAKPPRAASAHASISISWAQHWPQLHADYLMNPQQLDRYIPQIAPRPTSRIRGDISTTLCVRVDLYLRVGEFRAAACKVTFLFILSQLDLSRRVVIVTRWDRPGTKEPRCTASVMAGTSQPSDALEAARCISTHGLCKWAVLGIYLLMKRGAALRNWTVNSQIWRPTVIVVLVASLFKLFYGSRRVNTICYLGKCLEACYPEA